MVSNLHMASPCHPLASSHTGRMLASSQGRSREHDDTATHGRGLAYLLLDISRQVRPESEDPPASRPRPDSARVASGANSHHTFTHTAP